MALYDLSTTSEEFMGGNDSVAIKHYIHGKEGGAVLNTEGFPDDIIYAGHGVILDSGEYKPQPIDGSLHANLVGVVRSTTQKSKPSTGVMTQGTINNNALKYPFNSDSLSKLKELGIHNQVD
ncbi:MAG: hypothetical protein MK105_15155 [Crocinitomicaceae bacterium]|nr:hypothetical protein [Crocinitomicaceae bacterium]